MPADSSPHHLPPFLRREAVRQLPAIQECVARVVRSGRFLFGDELVAFEARLAGDTGRAFAAGCGSGTDAIELALRAVGVAPGGRVITQSHSSPFTVNAIWACGARPVLVDSSEDDFGMDLDALRAALRAGAQAVVPVHLYGHPVRIRAVAALAREHGVPVVEDCAQAHGALDGGRPAGGFGEAAAFSFYPTKNLGALGDGGAVVTDDAAVDARVRLLRNGGLVAPGVHGGRGITSRMNEVQAAVLRLRLGELAAGNRRRREHAAAYLASLRGVRLPVQRAGCTWAPHQFVVRHGDRETVRAAAAARGVPLQVHYPLPIHLQDGFRMAEHPPGSLPVAERLAATVLSLPTHPDMTDIERTHVADVLNAAVAASVGVAREGIA